MNCAANCACYFCVGEETEEASVAAGALGFCKGVFRESLGSQ